MICCPYDPRSYLKLRLIRSNDIFFNTLLTYSRMRVNKKPRKENRALVTSVQKKTGPLFRNPVVCSQ